MYWTNSTVVTTPIDPVDTSQESNQNQYPQLSATEIKKVLSFCGMSDTGKFEAIIANTDTAGLLAMVGMSYADLKGILALPSDKPTTAPGISHAFPSAENTGVTSVHDASPILSDTGTPAEHPAAGSPTLAPPPPAQPTLIEVHDVGMPPKAIDSGADIDAVNTPSPATPDMVPDSNPAPLAPAPEINEAQGMLPDDSCTAEFQPVVAEPVPVPENSDVHGMLPDGPCYVDLGEIKQAPADPVDLSPESGSSSLMSDAGNAETVEAFTNIYDFIEWFFMTFITTNAALIPADAGVNAGGGEQQNDNPIAAPDGNVDTDAGAGNAHHDDDTEQHTDAGIGADAGNASHDNIPDPDDSAGAGTDAQHNGSDLSIVANDDSGATNDAVHTPRGAEADAQNSGGDLHNDTKQNQNDDDSSLVSSELLLATPPEPGSTPPAELPIVSPAVPPVLTPVLPPELPPVVPPVVPITEPVAPVTEPVAPVTEPVAPVTEPVAPVTEPVAPVTEPVAPVTEPVAPVTEPVAPVTEPVTPVTGPVTPVTEPVTPVTEPVTPVTEPVTPVTELVIPPSEPVTPVTQQPPGLNQGDNTQNIPSDTETAGGIKPGADPLLDAAVKVLSSSSSISGSAGVDLSGSALGVGSESIGVVLGVAAGDVMRRISSGDFGFSFGGGGGSGGNRNRKDDHDTHNDTGGPGTTSLPPIIQIGHTPPDTNVHEVINNPPAPAPVLPLPPNELPGPGDMQDDDFIIDGVIDAINQHAGDAPADGDSEQGDQDHGSDGGDAHDNAPGPVPPPVSQDANINGAHAFIAHARAAITRMQAETIAANALVEEAAGRQYEARQAIDQAQGVINENDDMVAHGIEFIPTDYERLAAANAEIERWTTVLNAADTLINDKEVLIHQKTAEINIMRALIAQAQARIPGWGEQPGIADANANLDNAAGEDAANGGHANDFDDDVDIGGLPDGGNAGLDPAGDQPDQAPAPVDDPDADLPPHIVIATEVIAQGNALIDALRAHIALRQTDIAQNETHIFNRQNEITWLQDSRIRGVEYTSNQNGIPLSGPELTNWLRSVITNTQAQISEARADLDRALNDIAQLQAQIAHAQAEIDAWFHHHQNNAPGEHILPEAQQGVAPVDGALLANARVLQDGTPVSAQDAGAGLPPAYINAAYAHIAGAHAEIAELDVLIEHTEMDFDVAENRSHQIQEIITAERHAMADLIDNLNNGIDTNDQTTATLAEIEAIIANIEQGQTFANDAQTDTISADTIVQRAQAAIQHQEAVIAQSEAVIAEWQEHHGHAGAPANCQVSQSVAPPQNISLALVPAAQTNAPVPAGNAAVEAPLHYGTADMMNLDSVLLAFEFALPSSASHAADFIHHSHDIPALQGVLAHWMGSIGPGFAAPVVAFEMFDYNLTGYGGIMLQVLLSDWRVIPNEAALMALQNTMQEYLDRPDSPAPEHMATLDGTNHQALSLIGVESAASREV